MVPREAILKAIEGGLFDGLEPVTNASDLQTREDGEVRLYQTSGLITRGHLRLGNTPRLCSSADILARAVLGTGLQRQLERAGPTLFRVCAGGARHFLVLARSFEQRSEPAF